jgi:hypothetical protein
MSPFHPSTQRTVVVALAVAALAGALLIGGTGSAAAKGPGTMSFTVVSQDSEATIAPAEFFANPTLAGSGIEDAPVYRDGEKVGSAQTVVTATRVGDDVVGIIECSVELPEGNIFFDGSMHLAELVNGVEIPVVGGTGAYTGVIGVVTMTAAADGSSTTLAFELTQPGARKAT